MTVADGCFRAGFDQPEGQPVELVIAEELQDRMPLPGPFSEPLAFVGSSLTTGLGAAYVNGFEACTGADPSTIRFGTVQGGTRLGVIPMAIQVDGHSGWELAEIMIGGMLTPDQAAALRTADHAGWTYRYQDWAVAITASDDTVYLMQVFCCVDPMDPDADLPSFEEIIHDYLDRTNDDPAAPVN